MAVVTACVCALGTHIRLFVTAQGQEAEVKWFYEDLQNLLELMLKKDVLFIIGGWSAKVGSQELPGCCC